MVDGIGATPLGPIGPVGPLKTGKTEGVEGGPGFSDIKPSSRDSARTDATRVVVAGTWTFVQKETPPRTKRDGAGQ
jgi:hypothetical protein